ncbi:MAG: hydroxymethylbilane synthase [Nitrospirae bacterium]|nr:hydroxymethylbilane synthase [Nitrospirota bacterium]
MKKIIIATRGSKLALWQANWVKTQLEERNSGIKIELMKIKTTGDKILDVPLAKVGGKGLFVKEIEEALLREDADFAVHSMKDVLTDLPKGLHLTAICKREDPRDAFITRISNLKSQTSNLKNLPKGATVGTSSLRRLCQLLNIRPDLEIAQLRGNLDTRIRKLDAGQFDAIIVATAGVKRLGMAERITEILEPEISLPAIGQGAVGIECRVDDEFINNLLKPLNHPETAVCVHAERAFLKKLEGGCQVPIAAHARLISQESGVRGQQSNSELLTLNSKLVIDGLVGSVTGDSIIKGHTEGKPEDAESLGIKLAEDLLSRGAGKILAEVYSR